MPRTLPQDRSPIPATSRHSRTAAVLALVLTLVGLPGAFAQDDQVTAWATRHPAGSIRSTETADQVLQEAEALRQQVEARFLAEQNRCYDRFFVSHCLENAAERHRLELQLIRPVEIEANVWKRRAKVEQRDRNLEQQRERDQQGERQRAEQQRQREAEAASKIERKAQDGQEVERNSRRHEGEAERRIAEHAERLKKQQQEEAAKAGERARNTAEYERKRLASEARQREIAERKAEKARRKAAREGAASTAPAAVTPAKP